jgi:L-fuconolactonase
MCGRKRAIRICSTKLLADVSSGHNVVTTVFVQAHYGYRTSGPDELRCVGETEKIIALTEEASRRKIAPNLCAGIVAFADLIWAIAWRALSTPI